MPRILLESKSHTVDETMVLGRHSECDLTLPTQKASRQHCRISIDEQGIVWIKDLGSANGTYVNDQRITEAQPLSDKDRIRIADIEVTFRMGDQDPSELIGERFEGFVLGDILGVTDDATVYQARQLSLDRQVAFKIFHRHLTERDPELKKLIPSCARRAGNLVHPNIAQLHEHGETDGLYWYALELVAGRKLSEVIHRDGQLDAAPALLIAEHIGRALQAMHEASLVHGALSTQTVMVSSDGRVKLIDATMGPLLRKNPVTRKRLDPGFFSPEEINGERPTLATNIYQLGCIVYAMLTGRPPYRGSDDKETLRQITEAPLPDVTDQRKDLPKDFDAFLHGMLTKNPEWRYESIAEVQKHIEELRTSLSAPLRAAGAARDSAPKPAIPARPASGPKPTAGSDRADAQRESPAARRARERNEFWRAMNILGYVGALLVAGYIAYDLWLYQQGEKRDVPVAVSPESEAQPEDQPDARADATPSQEQTNHSADPVDEEPVAEPEEPEETAVPHTIIAGLLAENQYAEAEELLEGRLGVDASAGTRLAEVRAAATDWYRRTVADLDLTQDAQELRHRFDLFSTIRDQVASNERPDLESRWFNSLDLLRLRLLEQRRRAVELLEAGKLEALGHVLDDEKLYHGTPLQAYSETLRRLTDLAAEIDWQGSWPATLADLRQTQGAAALNAAAALMLSDLYADGRRLLLSEPALQEPPLAEQRDRLLRQEAAVLTFDRASDLTHLDLINGEPRLSGGALQGTAEQQAEFLCTVPVGGSHWEVVFSLTLDPDHDGEFLATIGPEEDGDQVMVRLGTDQVDVRTSDTESVTEASHKDEEARSWHVRLTAADHMVRTYVNHELVLEKHLAIPADSLPQFIASQVDWQLEELLVIGTQ